jgi:hypothetical protein
VLDGESNHDDVQLAPTPPGIVLDGESNHDDVQLAPVDET